MLLILAALSALLSIGNGEILVHFIRGFREGFGCEGSGLAAALMVVGRREGG